MSKQRTKSVKKDHRIKIDLNRLRFGTPISYKVIGLPGTGKTTFLINSVEEMIKAGIGLKDIIYCSHTKAAVHEVQDRLKFKFPHENNIIYTVRTIHSLCHSMVKELNPIQTITKKHQTAFLREFMKSTEFEIWEEFDAWSDEITRNRGRAYRETDLFKLSSNLQLSIPTQDPIELKDYIINFWEDLMKRDIDQELVQLSFLFHFQYLHYKSINNFFEFEDLLSYALNHQLYPNKRILIMDEFQDCSPLQFELYKLWSDKVQLSIIAGDPNQAIYGFQNSSPHFLISHQVSEIEILLNKSYRLPPAIVELAQQQMSGSKYLSEYKSDISITHHGEIEKVNLSDLIIGFGSTFILARTNSHLQIVSEELTKLGIPFNTKNTQITKKIRTELKKWFPVLKRVKSGGLTTKDIKLLIDHCQIAPPSENMIVIKRQHVFRFEDMKEFTKKKRVSNEEFLKIIELEWEEFLELFLKSFDNGFSMVFKQGLKQEMNIDEILNSVNSIQLMTIHKSKGKEADHVIIVDKSTYYEQQGTEDIEEERRVWYVAITRARKRLSIINLDNFNTKYLRSEVD